MVSPGDEQLTAVAALDDPTRRRLYTYVSGRRRPVTRDDAATDLGIDRSLVAYHLDRLVDVGLLVASFARPPGRRGGPGAGRPAKHYQRSSTEFAVAVPPRAYDLAAEVLTAAAAGDPAAVTAVEAAARSRGRDLAASGPSGIRAVLETYGFVPYDDDGVLRLGNCPFQRLASAHPELVCALNLALVQGVLDATGDDGLRTRLEPAPGRCCVALRPAAGTTDP